MLNMKRVLLEIINAFYLVVSVPDNDAVSLNTFFTVAEKVVFLPSPRVTLAERIMGCPSVAILASR